MAPSIWLTNWCADPSTRLTHQLEKDVGCKVLQFIHTIKITKLLGYKTPRRTNVAASWKRRWTRTYVSSHNILAKNLCILLHHLWRPLKQSLYMFRVVRKEGPNMYTRIGWNSKLKILFSKILIDRLSVKSCWASIWNSFLNLNRY